jgi:lipopolysaccharide/colanic/teichoic acid biosynthesis glycosyltransferase
VHRRGRALAHHQVTRVGTSGADGVVAATHRGRASTAAPRTTEALSARAAHPSSERCERLADAVLAVVALLVALPLMLLIAAAVKLDSRGPVLFRQRRLGYFGVPFTILKFRTMSAAATADSHRRYIMQLAAGAAGTATGEALNKLTDDARVTRVGAILRRLSLDELPQLLNVLHGDMALIGPRPALEYELRYYRPDHYQRFLVRPGLTGLWQVSGRARLGFHDMLDLDAEYVRTRSVRGDVRILLRTPGAMVGGRTA